MKYLKNFQKLNEARRSSAKPKEEKEMTPEQKLKAAYNNFFSKLLKKYGVSYPGEFGNKRKKERQEFYQNLDKGWDKDKGLSKFGEELIKEGIEERLEDLDELDMRVDNRQQSFVGHSNIVGDFNISFVELKTMSDEEWERLISKLKEEKAHRYDYPYSHEMTKEAILIVENEVKKILMTRDDMTAEEAEDEIKDIQQRIIDGENPEEILYEIGLEPDYIFDILPL
jgi:hypothetical protein